MSYFPIFIDLEKKACVVIGAGIVAFRKIEALLEFGANITVVAREICEDIYKLDNKINMKQKEYETVDIDKADLVIAATNDILLNTRISKEARERKIPVNVVDVIEECTFIFPAYIKRGDITIGITSSGKSPIISQKVKKIIEQALPPFLLELTKTLGNVRGYVKKVFSEEAQRKRVFQKITDIGFLQEGILKEEDIESIIYEEKNSKSNGGSNE